MSTVSNSSFTRLSNRWQIPLLIVLQALLFVLIVRYTQPKFHDSHTADIELYFRAARAFITGKLPYRDFMLEYPPLALVPFTLPLLAAGGPMIDFPTYIWWFQSQIGLLISLIAIGIALVLTPERPEWRTPALALYATLIASAAPLLSTRYDSFPALLTLLALYAAQRSRPGLAGWWLGCGVMAKLYPVVLLPIFGLYYVFSRQWQAVLRLVLGSMIAILGIMLPFFLLAPDDLFSFLRYHQERGLQIESLPAGIILLGHQLGWVDVSIVRNYGGRHLVSPSADFVIQWLPLMFVVVFGAVLVRVAVWFRHEYAIAGKIDEVTLVSGCVVALLAFISTNKVLSPQYLLWLLPFAPLLRVRHALAVGVICVLTNFNFFLMYVDLVHLQPLAVLILNLRNILIIALLFWMLKRS